MNTKAYRLVAAKIKAEIKAGHITGRLPSERALMAQFEVSDSTVKKALAELRSEGLISQQSNGRHDLASKKVFTRVGFLSPGPHDHFFSRYHEDAFFAVKDSLDETFQLFISGWLNPADEQKKLHSLLDVDMDFLIAFPATERFQLVNREAYELLARKGVELIFFFRDIKEPAATSISYDHRALIQTYRAYFLERACDQLVYVGNLNSEISEHRKQIFMLEHCARLPCHAIALETAHRASFAAQVERAREQLTRLPLRGEGKIGFLCWNDIVALTLMKALTPDLAARSEVIGDGLMHDRVFDYLHLDASERVPFPTSMLDHKSYEMGQMAAQKIKAMLQYPQTPKETLLVYPQLLERQAYYSKIYPM